jgi:hypothetical protein
VKKIFIAVVMVFFIFTSIPAFCSTKEEKIIFCGSFKTLVETMIQKRKEGVPKYKLRDTFEKTIPIPDVREVTLYALDLIYETKISELVYIPNQLDTACMENF